MEIKEIKELFMQDRIEKMAKELGDWALENDMLWNEEHAKSLATKLCLSGYRKCKDYVVLTKEEYNQLIRAWFALLNKNYKKDD